MRLVEGARDAVARGYPWSTRSSLLAMNSGLLQSKTIFAAGPCVSFLSFAATYSGIQGDF